MPADNPKSLDPGLARLVEALAREAARRDYAAAQSAQSDAQRDPVAADQQAPLDPDLVRFVEALAVAATRRDHRAALAAAAKRGTTEPPIVSEADLQTDLITRKQRRGVLPTSLPPRGLSRVESAAYVGVSPSLFDQMVRDHRMPGPKRINARTVWDRLRLDAAFAALPDDDAGPDSDPYAEVAS